MHQQEEQEPANANPVTVEVTVGRVWQSVSGKWSGLLFGGGGRVIEPADSEAAARDAVLSEWVRAARQAAAVKRGFDDLPIVEDKG